MHSRVGAFVGATVQHEAVGDERYEGSHGENKLDQTLDHMAPVRSAEGANSLHRSEHTTLASA